VEETHIDTQMLLMCFLAKHTPDGEQVKRNEALTQTWAQGQGRISVH
jgi:hypothetical protein